MLEMLSTTKCMEYYRRMIRVPWLNIWWQNKVWKVHNNVVWEMAVLLIIGPYVIVLVDNFNERSNGSVVQPRLG